MIFYLSILIFIILIISYFINHDILFPSNILVFSFLVASILASILVIQTKIDITFKVLYLIILFLISFVISSNLSYYIENSLLIHNNNFTSHNEEPKTIPFIEINKYKLIFLVAIQLFVLIIFIFKLKGILGQINSDTLSNYRANIMYDSNSELLPEYTIPSWINTLGTLSELISLVSIFILINNHFSNIKHYKDKLLLIISSIAYIPLTILSASRYSVIIIFIYSIFIYIYYVKYSRRRIIKAIIYVLVSAFAVVWLFGIVGIFIGRSKLGSTNVFITYGGGGVVLFNDYIKYPVINGGNNLFINNTLSSIKGFGANTFNAVYKDLYKLHIINSYVSSNIQEFRNINGISMGNVYTALRAYYTDFGMLGVIIMPSIIGAIFGYLYRKIKSIILNGTSIKLIIYAYINWTIVLSIYSETFYNTFLSFGFYIKIVALILIGLFYKI